MATISQRKYLKLKDRAALRPVLLAAAALVPRLATSQSHPERLQGRVTTDSGGGVAGAEVIATRAPDRAIFRASTDASGRYLIRVDSGTGDYLLHVSSLSHPTWPAFRKRVTRATPTDSILVVDVVLRAPAAQELNVVRVETERPTPERSEPTLGTRDVGGGERWADGVLASLSPSNRGNLAAIAATLPGLTPGAGGFTVLGARGDQSRTVLNGMSFPGAAVPRDARTVASVAVSPVDPSRGWFGSAETSVTLVPGDIFSERSASLSFDHPVMQWGDAISRQNGRQYTDLTAGMGGSGMLNDDRLAYSYGIEAGRRNALFATLGDASPRTLGAAGVAHDSVARLLALLTSHGVPTRTSTYGGGMLDQHVSLIARLNTPLHDASTFQSAKSASGLIVYAAHDEKDANDLDPLSLATRGSASHNDVMSLQGVFSDYLAPYVLEDVKSVFSVSDERTDPYLSGTGASVLVASDITGSAGGLASLSIGGSSTRMHNRTMTWESQSSTQFSLPGLAPHRFKVDADVRVDDGVRTVAANTSGSWTFNSLADLQLGRAAAFSRTLAEPERRGREWNGYVALSDSWIVTPSFHVLYGLRGEANLFAERPAFDSQIERSFGVRTDFAPNRWQMSPRVGFTWTYNGGGESWGSTVNPLGIFASSSSGVVRGSFGEYRAMLDPTLLAETGAHTGLPGSARSLACFGDAVPAFDWGDFLGSAPPARCAGMSSMLGNAAPPVQVVDRRYEAPMSRRGTLSWLTSIGGITLAVEGAYSQNVQQSGTIDLNFTNVPRFTLRDEGRPVFVPISSIATSTGAVSAVAARRDTSFGAVLAHVSDMRSDGRQVTVQGSRIDGPWILSLAYTLQSVRAAQRGFDGASSGSPLGVEWARSDDDVRHSFVLQAGRTFSWANISAYGRVSSGRPFSPLVAGDVNGDGLSNDRAFVFDPSRAADPAVVAAMRALMGHAPENVQTCLRAQLGQIAGRNSCEGPWTADLNLRVGLNTFRWGERWRGWNVELFVSNPLGGLDQALHGSNLRGWGSPALPNPVLLQVKGFDPTASRYVYDVNPRFGDTRPSTTSSTTPFRITLSVRADIGAPMSEQQVERFLRPGRAGRRGKKLDANELLKRYRRNVPEPYGVLLEQSDSLLLQPEQVRALQEAQAAFRTRVDSVWLELTRWLAALPDDFDASSVVSRQEAVIDVVWDMARPELQRVLPRILSSLQLRMLPEPVHMFYSAKEPIKGLRMFTYSSP